MSDNAVEQTPASLVLASASPRRCELLRQIGVHFEVVPADINEYAYPDEKPADYVQRLAAEKAQAVSLLRTDKVHCLGADTTVVQGSTMLEKPKDQPDFLSMMRCLSNAKHQVITGVCLHSHKASCSAIVTTEVEFREISEAEMLQYWCTGEPCDKAGGYGIQGFGGVFVRALKGSYSNVVGLPLYETAQLLQTAGIPVWDSAVK